MTDHAANTKALMRAALQAAVPLWQLDLKSVPWSELQAISQEAAQVVASKGDILQYRAGKPGETAKAFNALAKGLAVLSFCPGGVKFLGDHYEAQHDP